MFLDGLSCTGPCSSSGRQLMPPSGGQRPLQLPRATSQMQSRVPNAQTTHLNSSHARQIPAPQSRQLIGPQSRGLVPPQVRQLTPPQNGRLTISETEQICTAQSSQLALPRARQIVPPQTRQIPQYGSVLRPPTSLQLPQPAKSREISRLKPPTAMQKPSIVSPTTSASASGLRPRTSLRTQHQSMPSTSLLAGTSGLRPLSAVQTSQPLATLAEAPPGLLETSGAPRILRPPSALRPPKKTGKMYSGVFVNFTSTKQKMNLYILLTVFHLPFLVSIYPPIFIIKLC